MDDKEKIFYDSINLHQEILKRYRKTGFPVICKIVNALSKCFHNNGKLLLIGNGGSAADCQHIAGELAGRYKLNRIPLPAISLVGDSSVLTCIANDYNYEFVFSRQIEALANKNDIIWAFSTSGSSPNILNAVKIGRKNDVFVISFTGKKNSPLEKMSDVCLCAETEDTGHAQEIHQIAYHIVCQYIDEMYKE